MACKCNQKAKESNNKRRLSEKFVGFAIQFWGECYGKTQAEIDAVGLKKPTNRCTGSQNYSAGCNDGHEGCVGHGDVDYIYLLSKEGLTDIF